ncbi:MAG: cyclic nucleotide-binding domain-containing protein [Pseudomonadota bacterium]
MTNICDFFKESRIYQPGELIIREGEQNRDLYVLSEGKIEVSFKDNQEKVIVTEINPPEILGEISFLSGSPRSATITAKTRVEMYILSYDRVKNEMDEIPPWLKLILRTLTKRMQFCGQKIKELETQIRSLSGA